MVTVIQRFGINPIDLSRAVRAAARVAAVPVSDSLIYRLSGLMLLLFGLDIMFLTMDGTATLFLAVVGLGMIFQKYEKNS